MIGGTANTLLGIATLGGLSVAAYAAVHYPELHDLVIKPVRKVQSAPLVLDTPEPLREPQRPFDWARDAIELAPRPHLSVVREMGRGIGL